MSDLVWEDVRFVMPLDAHLYDKEVVDVTGAPFLHFGASEGHDKNTYVGNPSEPYIAFHTSDDPDDPSYRRPLVELLQYWTDDKGSASEPEAELAAMLLDTIEKWRAKRLK